ncbi:MAG TPA: ferritin-like domain-containing protein [Acidimicrobiales bacterium]|nr:ferritin-like domain-containing protein [Acidimicrobiales bacterium]
MNDVDGVGPDHDREQSSGAANRAEGHATFKDVNDRAQRIFLWQYERSRDQLVALYNRASTSQWSSERDLDWTIEVDPVKHVDVDSPAMRLYREAGRIPGSPLSTWDDREYLDLALELQKAMLSQFMHGEQGAMMTAAKIVETVPWIDARYYAATQTMDEARHTEVFARYLNEKLGDAYPMNRFLEEQITVLLEDSRWDIAYLGMQVIIESLALAAFGDMHRRTDEPLLKRLLRYVMSDEARHVAFGILSLSELYSELSEGELKERQEFLLENTIRNRTRATTPEVWVRLGVDPAALMPFVVEASAKFKSGFDRTMMSGFFSKLVPNVRKLGLLDANDGYLRRAWGEAGLLEFEFADDTASDYASYDEVSKDREEASAIGN